MRTAVTVLSVAAGLALASTATAQIHTINANASDAAILMAQTTSMKAMAAKPKPKAGATKADPHSVLIKTGPDTQRWYYITGVDSVDGTSCGGSKTCKVHLGGRAPENTHTAKLGGSKVFTVKDCSFNSCP